MNPFPPIPRQHATRLAPTPSGFLHAGNALSFLLTRELANRTNATLRLRIDDLDAERVRRAYVQDVFDGLTWLGIQYDLGPKNVEEQEVQFSQRLRLGRYHELIEQLWSNGDLYACTCTRARLERSGEGAHYPGTCRDRGLSPDASGATLRLRVPTDSPVHVPAWKGPDMVVDLAKEMGDPVLRQRSMGSDLGRPAYQIASLADDVDHGITLIVRGMDLLPSTACQRYLAERLGLESFLRVRTVHHDLVVDAQGRKLSKSAGSASLQAMRASGQGPEELLARAEELIARVL